MSEPGTVSPPPKPHPAAEARRPGIISAAPLAFAALVVPRRFGKQLARARWRTALLLHALLLLLALLVLAFLDYPYRRCVSSRFWGMSYSRFGEPPSYEFPSSVHDFITAAVNDLFLITKDRGDIYAVFAVLAAAHALHWLLAILAMPLVADGSSKRVLFGRVAKLSFWSSGVWILPAAGYGLWLWLQEARPAWLDFFELRDSDYRSLVIAGAGMLLFRWWLGLLLRLASGKVSPGSLTPAPDAYPACRECGYCLIGLPDTGRCPECGASIAESVTFDAEGQLPWSRVRRWRERPLAFVRTGWAVLRDREFYHRIPNAASSAAAVQFALWVSGFAGLAVGAGLLALPRSRVGGVFEVMVMDAIFVVGSCVALIQMVLLFLFALGVYSLLIATRTSLRTNTQLVGYASALFAPIFGLFFLAMLAAGVLQALAPWSVVRQLGGVDLPWNGVFIGNVAAFAWFVVACWRMNLVVRHLRRSRTTRAVTTG